MEAEAAAQLAAVKRQRKNARIALTHHSNTLERATREEGTSTVELQDLIEGFNTKEANLQEAHNELMLQLPEDDLEHEAAQ